MATTRTTAKKTAGNDNVLNAADYAGLSSKAEAVRKAHEEHPQWTHKRISTELARVGVELTPGRVSAVLRGPSNDKVDVGTIKQASEFARAFKDIAAALKAIEQVGGFIDQCGGSQKAKAALETYQAVSAAVQ